MTDQPPDGLEYVRTTETFDETNHPAGLERAHQVARRVWGNLVVHTEEVVFVFEDDADNPITVGASDTQVIPPSRKHHVEFGGPCTFAIEFYREREEPAPTTGEESTGLTTD